MFEDLNNFSVLAYCYGILICILFIELKSYTVEHRLNCLLHRRSVVDRKDNMQDARVGGSKIFSLLVFRGPGNVQAH